MYIKNLEISNIAKKKKHKEIFIENIYIPL